MRQAIATPFSFLVLLAPCSLAQAPARLTFADVGKALQWQAQMPAAAWASDGKSLEVIEAKATVWMDPATGTTRAKPSAGAAPVAAKVATVRVYDGDLWLEHRAPAGRRGPRPDEKPGPDAVRLTSDGAAAGKKEEAHLSPAGNAASFVRGNNLYLVDAATKGIWQVTQDGGPELFHGLLDWVYQEEIYGRSNFQGHWWNAHGSLCAFLTLDESKVREFTVVNHVPEGFLDTERSVVAEVTNYPKAGDPNPTARLSIAHRDSDRVVAVDLSSFPADALVVRVEWTPDGQTLLVTLQDRIQTWAEFGAVDAQTGAYTKWIREESKTWVNRPDAPHWLPDGSFLWLSERTGYQHVYRHGKDGALAGAVTSGDWQVRAIEHVDAARGLLWFEGTKDGATGRHLYRIGLDGQGLVCLTPGVGTHQYERNADGSYVLDRWTSIDHPTIVRVCDGATGAVVREIGKATMGDFAGRLQYAARRRTTIRARDGYELDATVQLPPDWQAGKRYPVFLPTYSGPDAPTVRDAWMYARPGEMAFHQFLAHQGFVVLQVNVRSASGRGQVHTGTCYQQLGVQELKDLEDAVDFVCKEHGGDPARVAITGWSYGGFITAYALTHSGKFALGLAGAGVYDWRLYDTVYTERYMRTPQQNGAGYEATSVIKAAKNLKGHLVLVHGSMDDNVHLQNTLQLLWTLQTAGHQDVELMVYPRSRHGLHPQLGPHHQEFQWRRLQRLLEPTLRW